MAYSLDILAWDVLFPRAMFFAGPVAAVLLQQLDDPRFVGKGILVG